MVTEVFIAGDRSSSSSNRSVKPRPRISSRGWRERRPRNQEPTIIHAARQRFPPLFFPLFFLNPRSGRDLAESEVGESEFEAIIISREGPRVPRPIRYPSEEGRQNRRRGRRPRHAKRPALLRSPWEKRGGRDGSGPPLVNDCPDRW